MRGGAEAGVQVDEFQLYILKCCKLEPKNVLGITRLLSPIVIMSSRQVLSNNVETHTAKKEVPKKSCL